MKNFVINKILCICFGIIIVSGMAYYLYLSKTETFTNGLDELRPGEKLLNTFFNHVSKNDDELKKITGFKNKKKYLYETLNEQERRLLVLYIKKALEQLNNKFVDFYNKYKSKPFHFVFIEIINATSSIDKNNNSRWFVDIMVTEKTLNVSLRLNLDFIINSIEPQRDDNFKTCAELTTPAFPIYFMGYPTFDQMIPLPTQVISSGVPGIILSNKGVKKYPVFKSCSLNKVSLENSDLVLGKNIITKSRYSAHKPDSNLSFYKYPSKRFLENENYDVELTKDDILTNSDSTETYNMSAIRPVWPKGWIQPSIWRNKWPRLLDEPKVEEKTEILNNSWDHSGINDKYDNIHKYKWSMQKIEKRPLYWPSLTGMHTTGDINNSMFSLSNNVTPNIHHGGHK